MEKERRQLWHVEDKVEYKKKEKKKKKKSTLSPITLRLAEKCTILLIALGCCLCRPASWSYCHLWMQHFPDLLPALVDPSSNSRKKKKRKKRKTLAHHHWL